jgi:hypothetical protein
MDQPFLWFEAGEFRPRRIETVAGGPESAGTSVGDACRRRIGRKYRPVAFDRGLGPRYRLSESRSGDRVRFFSPTNTLLQVLAASQTVKSKGDHAGDLQARKLVSR